MILKPGVALAVLRAASPMRCGWMPTEAVDAGVIGAAAGGGGAATGWGAGLEAGGWAAWAAPPVEKYTKPERPDARGAATGDGAVAGAGIGLTAGATVG